MPSRVTQDIPYALVPRWVIQALGLDLSAFISTPTLRPPDPAQSSTHRP